jgi:hypothetical protein
VGDSPLPGRAAEVEPEREQLLQALACAALMRRQMNQPVVAGEQDALLAAREQAPAAVQDLLEHRAAVGHRAADDAQHLGGRGLLLERLGELGRALLDLALEAGIRIAQLPAHAVELLRQTLELVARAHLDVAVEVAGTDACGTLLQRTQGPHQGPRQEEARRDGDQERGQEDQRGAQQGVVERHEGLGAWRFDEHGPAQGRDRGVGREDLLALDVERPGARLRVRTGDRGNLREPAQVRLLQDQADVGMRDQRTRGVDDIGEPGGAHLDARDHVPHELEVDLGGGHAAVACRPGDRHVRLGALAEVDRAVVDAARRRVEEPGLAGYIGPGADRVHCQPRDAQLLATARVDPRDLGDRRHLAQELQVLDATFLSRVVADGGARQRCPAELVCDVEDVLLDAGRRALGLLDLQGDQVGLGLAPREVDADPAARDQHAADQRHDQQRVLGKEPPATRHSRPRR